MKIIILLIILFIEIILFTKYIFYILKLKATINKEKLYKEKTYKEKLYRKILKRMTFDNKSKSVDGMVGILKQNNINIDFRLD